MIAAKIAYGGQLFENGRVIAQCKKPLRLGRYQRNRILSRFSILSGRDRPPSPGNDPAKAFITRPVFCQENQPAGTPAEIIPAIKPRPKLHAGSWANASVAALIMKKNLPIQIFDIRQGEGGVAEAGCCLDQLVNGSSSVPERIVTFNMQRDEHKWSKK